MYLTVIFFCIGDVQRIFRGIFQSYQDAVPEDRKCADLFLHAVLEDPEAVSTVFIRLQTVAAMQEAKLQLSSFSGNAGDLR